MSNIDLFGKLYLKYASIVDKHSKGPLFNKPLALTSFIQKEYKHLILPLLPIKNLKKNLKQYYKQN